MVPRRGLEPPRPCERQHLKLVRLPIPPPGHGASAFWQAAALKGAASAPCQLREPAGLSRHRHDRAATKSLYRVRRRRIHRPLRLRIPAEERRPGARRAARSAQRLLPPAARPRSASRLRSRPTSPTPRASRSAVRRRRPRSSTCAACSAARCAASTSRARATSPRRRATAGAEALVHVSAIGADTSSAVRITAAPRAKARRRCARRFPERDDHPPLAGVRARGRSHQPLRRDGAAAVPPGDRREAQVPAGLCPRPRARRSPWPRSTRTRTAARPMRSAARR